MTINWKIDRSRWIFSFLFGGHDQIIEFGWDFMFLIMKYDAWLGWIQPFGCVFH